MSAESTEQNAIHAGVGYTVGNILVKGIAFLTIPVFSWLMTTAQYGVYNTYSAYLSIFAVIVSLGLPNSVRNIHYDLPECENLYHSNSMVLIIAAMTVALAVLCAFSLTISNLLALSVPFLTVIVLNGCFVAIQSYYFTMLTVSYRYQRFLKLSVFYSVSSVSLSIVLICMKYGNNSAWGRALGNLVPMIFIAIYVLAGIWKNKRPVIRKDLTIYGLKFGLPLIPNDLSSLVLAQFDRVMIFRIIGETEAGIYSFAYNIAVIYQVLTNSVESAWTPWMFHQLHHGNKEVVCSRITVYVLILSGVTSVLILGSPELIMLMSRSAYWDSKTVVIPIIAAMYMYALAMVPVGMEFYCKKTGRISLFTFCTAICNIFLNAIFIPKAGYIAAAYTTLASYFLYALFHMISGGRLVGIHILRMPSVLISILFVSGISAVSIILLEQPAFRWIVIVIFLLIIFFGLLRNKETTVSILKSTFGSGKPSSDIFDTQEERN